MAEIANEGGKVQIVFLVDVFFQQVATKPQQLEEICRRRCKAISLCVLRLLLHFNASVGNSNRKKTFSWGFKFFNSRILNFEYKRRRFYDLDSQSFEKFEEELKERSENVCNRQETGSKQTCTGAKALSCSFAEILHDFNWITPDISSPFRSGKDDHLNDVLRKPRNLLFVVGDCPQDDNDLQYFLGRKVVCTNEDVLMHEIFSTALYEEFRNTCNLSLFWIDMGLWCLPQEKMDVLMKERGGCKLMTAVTKNLNGNMIPISSLTQDYGTVFTGNPLNSVSSQHNLEPDGATANKPCDKTLVQNCSQSELYNKVMQATFSSTFGGIVQAFLRGRDFTRVDVPSDLILSVPKRNGLLYGFLFFQGDERICHVKLSQMITEKTKQSSAANASSQQPHYLNVNVSKKNLANPQKSLSVAAVDDPQSMRSIDFCIEMNKKSESEVTEQDCENAFFIKGVISRGSVPPSWLHPTKLYSCLECGKPPGAGCPTDLYTPCSSGLLQQLLLLISSKGLNMVVEFRDPETCAPVIGLLQPVTSVCAVLSVVKTGMLLMIEKLLLNQKSHGSTLILRDVTAISRDVTTNDVTNPPIISVEVRENVQLPSSGLQNDPIVKKDSRQSNQITANASECTQKNNVSSKEKIVDSFVRDVVCKQRNKRKDGKELLLKLRDYYSKKQGRQAHERNEEVTVNQALTRGRLCQDTSLKNKATSNQESKSKPEKREEPEAHMISYGLDSDLTDAMEIDENPRNITDIKTVDDFKARLEEGYQKCLNLDHSAMIFVTHAFAMINHLESSCHLKDLQDQIMTILKSCVLRDNKSLREMIEKRGDVANKDKIVQEYKLQVYLRLELADKMEGLDQERLADEITEMLRAISFQKDPIYLNLFLKNSVITRYAGNLSKLLRHVYDGLMQRPPKEIQSPSQISSEEETPLKSRKVSSVQSCKSESVEETKNPRTLVRRHSVMGVPDKRREIVVPVKVKSRTNNSENARRSTSSGRKESSSKASAPVKSVTPVKKVRRNLFRKDAEGEGRRTSPRKAQQMSAPSSDKADKLSRRHSIATFSRSKKVNDTPACKQVSKRMLCRQESARRRAKTVTDVTVVGESPLKDQEVVRPFPRKSPRRKAATFYSSSSRTSLATTSKAAEQCSEDSTKSVSENPSNEESQNSGSPSLSSRATDKVNGKSSSCRRGFQRSLSLKQPASLVSDDVQFDEHFLDVFLDTNEATSHTAVSTQSSGDLTSKSHFIPSITTLTRRSKSSPSLSRSSHVASRQSPSDSKRPLNASKPFTSPVLKLQSRQLLDISIPLTPVLARTANIRSVQCPTSVQKHCNATTSFDERNSPQECSPSPRAKRPTVRQNASLGQLKLAHQINDDDTDSDSVVEVSPPLERKRSLLSSAEPLTYKTDLSSKNVEVFKKVEFIDGRVTVMNETNGGCPTMSAGSDGQTSGCETLKQNSDLDPLGIRDLAEVFTSPVATKRRRVSSKREHTSGSVSPLNRILKQRKNHRSNRPSTETDASSSYHDIDSKRNPVKIKFPLPTDCEFQGNKESSDGADIFHNSCRTNVPLDCSSDETMRSPNSQFDRNKLYLSPSTSRSCSLQPHFTPMALSARSLRHLEESPVLLHPSSQSSDCPTQQPSSLTRKWSERRSPLGTSRPTLCKRLRHDS